MRGYDLQNVCSTCIEGYSRNAVVSVTALLFKTLHLLDAERQEHRAVVVARDIKRHVQSRSDY